MYYLGILNIVVLHGIRRGFERHRVITLPYDARPAVFEVYHQMDKSTKQRKFEN